jgi:hypothetical protein
MRALMVPMALCLLFAAGNASASWIRYLLLEYEDGSNRPMKVLEQSRGGDGPWTTEDPNLGTFFGNFASDPVISNLTSSSVTIAFDLWRDPNLQPDDPLQGAGIADVGVYNFFEKGTAILAATLEVSQTLERVTIDYLSAVGGSALSPLPGGTAIDGIPPYLGIDVPFGSLPVCGDAFDGECWNSRANYFPLGLYVQVARVPEPAVIPLLGSALFAAAAVGRVSRRRSVHAR